MPAHGIVDSHVHVWDPDRIRYDWLADVPQLRRRYGPADLTTACGAIDIDKYVFVQAEAHPDHGVDETRWVSELARDDSRLAGAVAWAPVERGDAVVETLEALRELPLVRGVRRLLQDETDPEFCLRPCFVTGVRRLAEPGFSFDLCVRHWQLPNVTELVRQCPDVAFVLDHIGKPDIAKRELDPWRADLRTLADQTNVVCKLSGLATEADHASWTTDDLRPYIEHAVECFGFDRLMFGGDWPVAVLATSYPRWVETVDAVLAGCADDELRRLYRDNAIRTYRLE